VWQGSSYETARSTPGYQWSEWIFTTKPLGGGTIAPPTMTGWGPEDGSGFFLATPDFVLFTKLVSPGAGAIFASPANVDVSANWYIEGWPITSVSIFANSTIVASTTPSVAIGNLTGTTGGLGTGKYSLVSVLYGGPGLNYTSAPVNITVVEPVAVSVTSPRIQDGPLGFGYTANPGLRYLIESSSDLQVWQPVLTNVPTASPAQFSDVYSADDRRFYRVGRLPNP
jgi:hypothetical protein